MIERTPGGETEPLNIFTTLARHPALVRRWLPFGTVMLTGALPPRDRELLILRTAWNCRSAYEWGQHVRIGLAAGVTQDEIDRVPPGPGAPGWSPLDAALHGAADELHADLAQEEIDRVPAGPSAAGWSPFDAALLGAADELHADACVSDRNWAVLAERYGEPQLIEVPMLVGQYHMVAFTLNSLGVQREPGVVDLPSRAP